MKRDDPEHGERKWRQWRASLQLSAAGITFAFAVLIGTGIGYMLDQWLKTVWITPAMAVLGVVAGFRELFRALNAANRAEEEERRSRKDDRHDRTTEDDAAAGDDRR